MPKSETEILKFFFIIQKSINFTNKSQQAFT